jgi:hypothetical protein
VIAGDSVGIGVSVSDGVGEDAEAVPVNILIANRDSSVPMLSTGGGVGLPAHPVTTRTSTKPSVIQFRKCVLISSPIKGIKKFIRNNHTTTFLLMPYRNEWEGALKGYKRFTV